MDPQKECPSLEESVADGIPDSSRAAAVVRSCKRTDGIVRFNIFMFLLYRPSKLRRVVVAVVAAVVVVNSPPGGLGVPSCVA